MYAYVGGAWTKVSADSGGETGSEVAIGPDDPIGTSPEVELWFDTDAASALLEDQRWNTAWGVVAVGSFTTTYYTTTASAVTITNPLTYTTVVGRRYRLRLQIRVIHNPVGGVLNVTFTGMPANDSWTTFVAGSYGSARYEMPFNGTGTSMTHVVNAYTTPAGTGLWLDSASFFVLEDVGPVSGAAALVMPTTDRWNTAWGIVAMGAWKSGMVNPATVPVTPPLLLTDPLNVMFLAGRRYRIVLQLRAINGAAGAYHLVLRPNDGGATKAAEWGDWYATVPTVGGTYNNISSQWTVDGDGLAHSITIEANTSGANVTAHFNQNCRFFVEDIGPISGAAPIPNPTPLWTTLTLGANWERYDLLTPAPAYRKIGDEVQVRGYLKAQAGAQNPVCTLPVGFRPPYDLEFSVNIWNNNEATLILGYIVMQSAGTVIISAPTWTPRVACPFNFQFSVTP